MQQQASPKRAGKFQSLQEAQAAVQFNLKELIYIPGGLALQEIRIEGLDQVPAQYIQTVLDNIRSGAKASGSVTVSYRGDLKTRDWFSLAQGYQTPDALDGLPSEAHGEVTLQDGSVAVWILGGWTGGSPRTGVGRYERNDFKRLYWFPDLSNPSFGYKILATGNISVEELVKVANSLAPLP